jgi:hypothetical protein
MTAISRRTALVAMAGAAGAIATGCAISNPEQTIPRATVAAPTPTASTPTPTPTPTEDTRPRAPLTGEVVDDPAALNHAAVAVKVSDVQSAHPQYGLNDADIVFAEPNGISYIRLCAVFHTKLAESVGPVRSIRPVDVPLLSPIKPVFGNTAAANWVMHYVASFSKYLENLYSFKAGVHGTGAYTTLPHRARVHSVCCHPDKLRQLATTMTQPPANPYLPFAVGDEVPSTEASGKPAEVVSVPWGPGNTWNTSYHYDQKSKRYLRNEPWGKHVLADGSRVHTDNVIVVRARWTMDKIFEGTGAPDPVVQIINATGTFYYAHQGRYVTGTWAKGAVDELFQFTLDDGTPLKVAPGRTFIELPQRDAKVTITA